LPGIIYNKKNDLGWRMNQVLQYFGHGDMDTVMAQLIEWNVKVCFVLVRRDGVTIRVFEHPALYRHLSPGLMDIKANGELWQADLGGFAVNWVKSNAIPNRSIKRALAYDGKRLGPG
jgi:hypothetical protein